MTDRSTTTAHAGIRAFVARRPVTAFLIMAFSIAYPVMSLIAVVVLTAALALLAGRRQLSRAYRLQLDANPGGVARQRTNSPT